MERPSVVIPRKYVWTRVEGTTEEAAEARLCDHLSEMFECDVTIEEN